MAMVTARQFLASAAELESARRRCGGGGACDMREDGGVEAMLQCQRVSDLLIAASFLSIPLELFYFATCADLSEIKWAVLHFCAFIVLCGATHLLAAFTHAHPHSAPLLRALTAAKVLAAVASSAAAVSLLTFIPKLLRLKVRESLLRDKASRLHRDLGLVRRREEATSRAVRELTGRIRGSPPDAHAILRTTALQLADALGLNACAVWMPAAGQPDDLVLVHQLSSRPDATDLLLEVGDACTVAADDPDVVDVMASKVAKVLEPDSALAMASTVGGGGLQAPAPAGAAAAIRIPILRVSIYDGGGTPEVTEASYAILVLLLPHDATGGWSSHDLEIVQVVADQAAVALSHAAVLEESRSMRDRFAERHRALMQAKHQAAMATRVFSSIQSAILCDAMRRPVDSIVGLVSVLQHPETEKMRPEQRLAVDAIARTGKLLSALMDDVMDAVTVNRQHLSVQRKPFSLHALIKEAISIAGCLSHCRGAGFLHQPECALPEWVVGDERRVFHLLLDMVGTLSSRCNTESGACRLSFSVRICNVGEERYSLDWIPMRPTFSGCNVCVKFKVGIERSRSCAVERSLPCELPRRSAATTSSEMGHIFSAYCNKIVQMMNGNMWSASDSEGVGESVTLILQFKLQQGHVEASPPYIPHFNGLRVLLADDDTMNRRVTQKILERLGCQVMLAPSGAHCLSLLASAEASFQLVVLDLDDRAMVAAAAMDGFEAALRIRELRNSFWLLIVVAVAAGVVADDGGAVQELCQRAGINGLVQKPVTLRALGAQLCRVLQDN